MPNAERRAYPRRHWLELALVPNRVVDGVRAPIVRLQLWKPQSEKGPSWLILVPA